MNDPRKAYEQQKKGAKCRGIEFLLTFKQWLEWWGDDIARRGTSKESLQMQRIADSGAYELGNIRKGTPKENMRTMGRMRRKRNTEAASVELQQLLNRAMYEPSAPPEDQDERAELGFATVWADDYRQRK